MSLAAALNTPVEERRKTVCVLTGGSKDAKKTSEDSKIESNILSSLHRSISI